MQTDMVERVHFDTKSTYTVNSNHGKAVFKCKLTDPDPKMPAGFDQVVDVQQGDYVLVSAKTAVDVQRGNNKFLFKTVDQLILTLNWQEYEEDMALQDLMEAKEDFLVYYQLIDTNTDNCKSKQTARASTKVSSDEDTADDSKPEDDEVAPKKPKKKQVIATMKNTQPTNPKRRRT
jgi:hypothetical protein